MCASLSFVRVLHQQRGKVVGTGGGRWVHLQAAVDMVAARFDYKGYWVGQFLPWLHEA